MRGTSKSLANQYGISQKNLSNNNKSGIGLNPNLNIEDQYIENLLKQVHFLSMEIKLVKQKQKQNKGMGIMGLLNKDQNPVVSHAITSNAKFVEMKSGLEDKVNMASAEYSRLDDQNFATKAQRDYLQKISLKEEQKNIENKIYVEKQLSEGIDKLRDWQKKLQNLRQQNDKIRDNHRKLTQQWEKAKINEQTKILIRDISSNLEAETHKLKQNQLNLNTVALTLNTAKLNQAQKLFQQDPIYKQLVQENIQLKEKLVKTDKELFDLNYRVKEKQELRKLSIRNKDAESELKKQAFEESQRVKKKLVDKQTQFQNKCKESKIALQLNDQVKLIKGKINRKDKEIMDLKKRTEVSQQNYKRLRQEVMKLQTFIAQKKQANKKKQEQINKLNSLNNQIKSELGKAKIDFEQVDTDLKSSQKDLNDARKRYESLEQQLQYLSAKNKHLEQTVDVEEQMKNVKIQQLLSLSQSNNGLNSTIKNVMEQWEDIIKFSRGGLS